MRQMDDETIADESTMNVTRIEETRLRNVSTPLLPSCPEFLTPPNSPSQEDSSDQGDQEITFKLAAVGIHE